MLGGAALFFCLFSKTFLSIFLLSDRSSSKLKGFSTATDALFLTLDSQRKTQSRLNWRG